MLNIEKYKDDINTMEVTVNQETGEITMYGCPEIMQAFGTNRFKMKKFLNWLAEEYKEQLLTDKEREYLKAVFKPFHDENLYITKKGHIDGSQYLIVKFIKSNDFMTFPYFERGTLYKGMEGYHDYTLEELGITYDD